MNNSRQWSMPYALQAGITLSGIIVAAVLLSNWPTYHYVILDGPTALTYFTFVIGAASAIALYRPQSFMASASEPVFIWFVVFAITGLFWLLIFVGQIDDEVMRQWRLRALGAILFLCSLVLTSESNPRAIAKVILACALLASINNWLDFLFPFNFVPLENEQSNPGRGAGLFLNANQAAFAVITMLITCMPFLDMRYRALAVLMMLVGVYPTFSRSALLFAVIVALLFVFFGLLNRRQTIVLLILAPIFASIGLALHEYGTNFGDIDVSNIDDRIAFFLSGGEAHDESANERRYVAQLAADMFASNPILGNGIGSTLAAAYGRGTHDMYLMLLAEQGILGGILYITLVFLIFKRGIRVRRQATTTLGHDIGLAICLFAAHFAFIGLFSHNLLEEPFTQFDLAFLLTCSRRYRPLPS